MTGLWYVAFVTVIIIFKTYSKNGGIRLTINFLKEDYLNMYDDGT